MEDFIKQGTIYLATAVEAGAALLIGIAAVQALIKSFGLFLVRTESPDSKEMIRLQLGRWLSVALEFELAADILRTGISPSWSELGQLAAIVILRIVLNFFLQLEIDRAAVSKVNSKSVE